MKLGTKSTAAEAKKEAKKDLGEFYENQSLKSPDRCENCGNPLHATVAFHPRAHICHIVPKETFVSVMTHVANIWFGCLDCHTMYDSSWSKARLMNVWPLVVQRFKKFMREIAPEEVKSLPESLRKIYDDASI